VSSIITQNPKTFFLSLQHASIPDLLRSSRLRMFIYYFSAFLASTNRLSARSTPLVPSNRQLIHRLVLAITDRNLSRVLSLASDFPTDRNFSSSSTRSIPRYWVC